MPSPISPCSRKINPPDSAPAEWTEGLATNDPLRIEGFPAGQYTRRETSLVSVEHGVDGVQRLDLPPGVLKGFSGGPAHLTSDPFAFAGLARLGGDTANRSSL